MVLKLEDLQNFMIDNDLYKVERKEYDSIKKADEVLYDLFDSNTQTHTYTFSVNQEVVWRV